MSMLIWILPVLVVLFGGVIAAIPIFFAVRFHRRGSAVANMQVTSVKQLEAGPAKIKARVRAREELLVSPMGRHPCVYYRFLVREMRQTGGKHGGQTWHTVVDDSRSIDVILEDDTGKAKIDLRDAEVVLKTGKTVQSGTFNDPPESLPQLLQRRYGRSTKGLLFNKRMSYEETILPDDAKVIVVGEVEPSSSGVPELRKGDVPLLVGDREDDQLRTPYRRKAVWCWVGAGFLLFTTGIFTVGAVMIALSVSVVSSVVESASNKMKAVAPAAPVGVGPGPGDVKGPGGGGIPNRGNVAVPPVQREAGLDQWLADLRSPDQFQRKAAADRIGQTPVVEARRAEVQKALEPLLQEDQFLTTGAALKTLQTWGDKNIIPTLVQMLQNRASPVRRQVMETLAKFPDERGADAVAETLTNLTDRRAAGTALRAMGPIAEKSVMRQLQANPDSLTAREACDVLAKIGSPASLPTLDKLAGGRDRPLVVAARRAADAIRKRNPKQ